MTVDVDLMDNRVKILEAVHEGRIGDSQGLLQDTYKGLLEKNGDIHLAVVVRFLWIFAFHSFQLVRSIDWLFDWIGLDWLMVWLIDWLMDYIDLLTDR